MSKEINVTTKPGVGGIGFLDILGLLFLTLYLTGYIQWPLFYVLLPFVFRFIGIFIIAVSLLIAAGGIAFLCFAELYGTCKFKFQRHYELKKEIK